MMRRKKISDLLWIKWKLNLLSGRRRTENSGSPKKNQIKKEVEQKIKIQTHQEVEQKVLKAYEFRSNTTVFVLSSIGSMIFVWNLSQDQRTTLIEYGIYITLVAGIIAAKSKR